MKDWSEDQIKNFITEGGTGLVYFYTPICGTCQMASRMLEVVTQLFPDVDMGKADLNYMPDLAEYFEVQSVPCLLLITDGVIREKIFAFHSVPYLHEKIKQNLR